VLRKDLLRVSRAGGGYHPRFVGRDQRPLAARVIGAFQGHVGETRRDLDAALEDLERESPDFKLVRGFAALLERDAVFETESPVPPRRARRTTFEVAEDVGVVTEAERAAALSAAGERLGVAPDAVERSLYADREVRGVLTEFDPRWGPDALLEQYDLSLAQTALFDATEVRVRSDDPRAVVSAVKRLGLMYEIRRLDDGDEATASREIVVTGPDSLFRRTRRYGTSFARLLRAVAATSEWSLTATVDDRGRERELRLDDGDVSVPGVDPVAEPSYDSGVEADFAARFEALDLDWVLTREPEPLAAGSRVMIPDFAFDYAHADFRVFFEIMGFWTPEYVEKKLHQLENVEDVSLLVAVDDSLGVGEAIEARDHRAIPYSGSVRVKDVVDALREFEADLVERASTDLPEALTPDADVIELETLAADYGVSVDAVEDKSFPEHELLGRTLVRPSVIESIAVDIEPGMDFETAEERIAAAGVDDASAALSRLGYRVAWEGLSGGTLREKDGGSGT
jgi:predicted nuclease of restriction endonuclease-like RecB superfamily